jgi:hypothetical protein
VIVGVVAAVVVARLALNTVAVVVGVAVSKVNDAAFGVVVVAVVVHSSCRSLAVLAVVEDVILAYPAAGAHQACDVADWAAAGDVVEAHGYVAVGVAPYVTVAGVVVPRETRLVAVVGIGSGVGLG